MNKFSKRLKLLRKEMGLTQAELAEKLGLKQATIAKWEKGGTDSLHRLFY